jgi:hypothetical protein
MGVVRTCSPVAWCFQELLLGNKVPAVSTLELFFIDFVIAGFSETVKRMHRISSELDMKSSYGDGILSTLHTKGSGKRQVFNG